VTSIELVHQAAREAYSASLAILPPAEDGTKRPLPHPDGKWEVYKRQRPTTAELRTWYPGRTGIGLVAGAVSAHARAWDFDDFAIYQEFIGAAIGTGHGALVQRIENGYCGATPADGRRWIVRCPEVPHQKEILARRLKRSDERHHERDEIRILIEIPDYAVLAPSNGSVHPSGKPYVRLSGGFTTIATINPDEHGTLIALAKSFDQIPNRVRALDAAPSRNGTSDRPGG
jgi:hypothetical protein